MNQLTIIGNLGHNPEMRYVPSGEAVTSFSLAVNRKVGDREVTDWFSVSAWGKLGDLCNQYLAKGSQCLVQGRVRIETWTAKNGEEKSGMSITADKVQFLGSKPVGQGEKIPAQGEFDDIESSAERSGHVVDKSDQEPAQADVPPVAPIDPDWMQPSFVPEAEDELDGMPVKNSMVSH